MDLEEAVEKIKVWAAINGHINLFSMLDGKLTVNDYLKRVKSEDAKLREETVTEVDILTKLPTYKRPQFLIDVHHKTIANLDRRRAFIDGYCAQKQVKEV